MMELLVFLVLLFGLFGVISAQYLIQYREAYALWIKEIVYANSDEPLEKKRELCSRLESYSRETCGLADFIFLVFIMICIGRSDAFAFCSITCDTTLPKD